MAETGLSGRHVVRVKLRSGTMDAGVAYLRAGRGSPVVLIHGVGMNADVWAPQMDALSRHHDVIAMDMPGHGASDLPPEDAVLGDYYDAVIGLMDALALRQAALVGHSMGALVATGVALAHPERVSRLVAMNAVFRRPPELKQAVAARAAELDANGITASVAPTLARWFGDPAPDHLAAMRDIARAALEGVNAEGYRRTYRLFAASDEAHADDLPGLAVPALFLTGEHDANSSPAMSREMADLAPRGVAEVLPGVRHMMAMTHPDTVNRSLHAFLLQDEPRLLKARAGS